MNGPLIPPPDESIPVKMRFDKRDITKLKEMADWLRGQGRPSEHFAKAAEATEHNDGLIVWCSGIEEARKYAQGYVLYGIRLPTLEEGRRV